MSSGSLRPLEFTRWRHRARFDEYGVTIGRKPLIAWDEIAAVGTRNRLVGAFPSGVAGVLMRPCLHLCVRGDLYATPVPAVPLHVRSPDIPELRDRAERELRDLLGGWLDRVPVVCPLGDLEFWWVGHGGKSLYDFTPKLSPKEPSTHERVEKMHHELEDMNEELKRVERRRTHDL